VRCIELGARPICQAFDPVLLGARHRRLPERNGYAIAKPSFGNWRWNQKLEQRVKEQVARFERPRAAQRVFSSDWRTHVAVAADDPLAPTRPRPDRLLPRLRGFTAFAESVEPRRKSMGVLREYHAEMGRLVMRATNGGGTLADTTFYRRWQMVFSTIRCRCPMRGRTVAHGPRHAQAGPR